jgi:O-antigen ligase
MCQRRLRGRIVWGALFALMAASVLLSGSRGAFLAAAAIIVYVGVRLRKYVNLAAIVATGAGLVLLIPTTLRRFTDPTQGQGSGRTDIWKVGWQAFHGYWLAGAGFAAFPDAYDLSLLNAGQHAFQGWSRVGHNLIVQTAVELGIVGLVVVLFAWWTSFRQNRTIGRDHPNFAQRVAVEACILGLFCDAMTLDLLWYKYFWLALSLAVLLANANRPRLLFSARVLDGRPVLPKLRLRRKARPAGP